MIDHRDFREVAKSAIARERKEDENWTWRLGSVTKGKIGFEWGYLTDYLGEKNAEFSVVADIDDVVGGTVLGTAPDGHRVIKYVGDDRWSDVRTIEEGVAGAIHALARYAKSVY